MNVGVGPDGALIELPEGGGPWFPDGVHGVLAALPFAVWLYLAIEQLPLAAEESVDPKRDMPTGILLGIFTLVLSAFAVLTLNSSIAPGSWGLRASGEPLLEGFRTLFGTDLAKLLALVAIMGLVASFHAIIFAFGRQIYSLSRAGYFPRFLSVTHGRHETPQVALDRRQRRRPRRHALHLVRVRPGDRRRLHRRRAAQHGGVRRHDLLRHAGDLVHPAAHQPARHRAPLPQPLRHPRRRSPPS